MSPDDHPAASVPSNGGAGLSACVIVMNEEDIQQPGGCSLQPDAHGAQA